MTDFSLRNYPSSGPITDFSLRDYPSSGPIAPQADPMPQSAPPAQSNSDRWKATAAWLKGVGPEWEQNQIENQRLQAEADIVNDINQMKLDTAQQTLAEQHKMAFFHDISAMDSFIRAAGDGPVDLTPIKHILAQRVVTQKQFGTPFPGDESETALRKLDSGDPAQIAEALADIQQTKMVIEQKLMERKRAQKLYGTNADIQYGASTERYQDQSGNLFAGTTERDKSGRSFTSVLTPIGHNNPQDGSLIPVNDFGLTPEQMVKYKGDVTSTEQKRKDAATESYEVYKRIEPIRANISRLSKVVELVDRGVNTGTIISRMPSLTATAKELDYLQNRLGLDVLRTTTFGALSEKELEFALDTALPKKMEGPELKQWALQTMAAQRKLSKYLEDAALFLSREGSISEWIQQQRDSQGNFGAPLPPTNDRGWPLVEDAQGNKAYMGPNGQYEEVSL